MEKRWRESVTLRGEIVRTNLFNLCPYIITFRFRSRLSRCCFRFRFIWLKIGKKKKKKGGKKSRIGVLSNANIFAQIHLCIHCKIALDVDHGGGREQCDLSRFPWRPLIFAAQISAKSFPRSIRKMIRYYSLPIRLRAFPPILATIKRLSSQRRKCFDLDSFKSGFKGSKRI